MTHLPAADGFWGRFRNWWDGNDELFEDFAEVPTAAGPVCHWSTPRVVAVQMVCGDGANIPGGGRFAKASIKYLGLNNKMSVVDYGAQLGLFGRVATKTAGCWVDLVEPDLALAEAAEVLTHGRRLAKRITVHPVDPLRADIRARSRDAVIAVEAMHRWSNRPDHLQHIVSLLKPGGRLLMIDFFREIEAPSSPTIDTWCAREAIPPGLPRMEHLQKAMRRSRLRVTHTEDITAIYVDNLTKSLRRLAKELGRQQPDTALHAALLREVEFWGARLNVLKSGDVSVQRLIGIMPG